MDMGSVGADYGMVRAAHGIDTEHIGTGAVENKIHLGLGAESLTEEFFCALRIFVIAVSHSVFYICRGNGLKYFGADARVIVATKSALHCIWDLNNEWTKACPLIIIIIH